MSILSCSTTKQKIDVSTSETTSTKINKEDSTLLVRVVSDKINTSLNVSDFSKIKITYYSDKKDTSGNQIIDRIEERENNIIAQSVSDQKIIDSTRVKNNTKTNYQEDKKITTIAKTKTKKKPSPLIYFISIFAAAILIALIVRVSK
jgi:aspartyl-tRNA synthetase